MASTSWSSFRVTSASSRRFEAAACSSPRRCSFASLTKAAVRYDKLARNFLAAVCLVGALYWLKL